MAANIILASERWTVDFLLLRGIAWPCHAIAHPQLRAVWRAGANNGAAAYRSAARFALP